jgi:hypothetical protein
MTEQVSERLLDQRLRNRVMEVLWGLTEWERRLDFYEYFESYFDFFPYEGAPYSNGAMTPDELAATTQVHKLMLEAAEDTPREMSEKEFVATGWPQRIAVVAESALRLMLARGRFSEDVEEVEPTTDGGWPWRDRFRSGGS